VTSESSPTPWSPPPPPPTAIVAHIERAPDTVPVPSSSPARPLDENQRIHAIDVLRGVALLGILVMNIQSFAMPGAAYMNPLAYGDLSGGNYWVWHFSYIFAFEKFMSIFSMLFGAGIVLMTSRIEASGRSSAGVHYRRMAWLVLFGLLHAHLLWYGDILFFYGTFGMIAWLFRKLPPGVLIPLGLVIVGVASALSYVGGWSVQFWPPEAIHEQQQEWQPTAEALAPEINAYRGSWIAQMPERTTTALMFETFIFAIWGVWRAGGLMLVGMGFFKLGIFSARARPAAYWAMICAALFVGVPVTWYGIHKNFEANWVATYAIFNGSHYNYWGSILVSLGWVGAVMLAFRSGIFGFIMKPLAAVGRMALTNYLMHTIICTTIFYGHGLGLFGSVERVGQFAIVVGVWVVQLIVSPIWLRYFQFGPAEWLWRTLTYFSAQPMLRRRLPAGNAEIQAS
jgi:uncharacterized protein